MGDRIYQGFRVATDSFAEALRMVEAFRPWVKQQSEKQLDTFMATVMKEAGVDSVSAFDMWQDRRNRIRREQCRIPVVDTDFNVVLVPCAGFLLGRVYTEQRLWLAEWYKQPGIEEFSYWDNMEPPEGVSDEDWAARGTAWEVITDDPMSMQGFSIELVSPTGPMPKAWRRP